MKDNLSLRGAIATKQSRNETASLPSVARNDAGDIVSRIGTTPLIPLKKIGRLAPHVTLLAKAEWFNPGGSVKDRAASNIIATAERSGLLTPEKILLDATSGNTGVAYAMIGAAKGYRVKLCVPANASPEILKTMKAFGADLVLTDPLETSDGAIREARRLAAAEPNRYFYADQYNNPANWKAHYETTGPEIWEQTEGTVTHFIAGMGTSGTVMGTGRRLKEFNPSIQIAAVQPDAPLHGLEGLKHMATSIVPGIYNPSVPDLQLEIRTEDAYRQVKRLAVEEGLWVGISAGAALHAGLEVAEQIKKGVTPPPALSAKGGSFKERGPFRPKAGGGVIVMIFPDGGSRYLDEQFWKENE